MQYLKSDDTVPEEVDRMHVRDNLKAVQVSQFLLSFLFITSYTVQFVYCHI